MRIIDNWRKATEEVAKTFTKKYFPKEVYGKDTFWVADEIGGVFFVSDMFFDIDRMIAALEHKAKFDQIYDYYHAEVEHCMENPDKPMHTNFKNYIKHGFVGS